MRIQEIITENDELNEVWPIVPAVVGAIAKKAAPAVGRAAKSVYNTVKTATTGAKTVKTKAQDIGGMPRSFTGGKAVSHGGVRNAVDKVNKVTKTQQAHLSGKTVPPGAKSMTSKKPTATKPNKKTDKKVDPNAQMKYSGSGRYTHKIPKK